jgi:hypothetical protein
MLSHLLHRMRRQAGAAEPRRRVEVCPPSLLHGRALAVVGWRDWLGTSWSTSASPPQGWARGPADRRRGGDLRLGPVRDEFLEALHDLRSREAALLRHRVGIARSLRELWHLRPEVFKLLALGYSQAEAQRRLDSLNRHFPTRSPRSGFAPL